MYGGVLMNLNCRRNNILVIKKEKLFERDDKLYMLK